MTSTTGLARVRAECKSLHSALQRVGVAVKRSTLPILSHVHFTAEGDTLTLRAGFDSTSVTTRLQADVGTGGEWTLPHNQTLRLMGYLSGSVDIQVKEKQQVQITCGKSKHTLLSHAPEEYPTMPVITEDAMTISVGVEALAESLGVVFPAASDDEVRPILCGVCMEIMSQELRFVATDTHRLAMHRRPGFLPGESNAQCVLSADGVADLLSLLKGGGQACIRLANRSVQIDLSDAGQTSVILRLVEGSYPNYKRIIPTEHAVAITLPVAETLAALKRLELTTDDRVRRTTWSLSGGRLAIRAESAELGNAVEEVEATIEGDLPDYVFAMNARYVQDALAMITTEQARLRCPDSNLRSFLLEPVTDHADRLAVLMPLQVL